MTTLVGLIASICLKVQNFNLEYLLDEYKEKKIGNKKKPTNSSDTDVYDVQWIKDHEGEV